MDNFDAVKLLMDSWLQNGNIKMFSVYHERSGSVLVKMRIFNKENGGLTTSDGEVTHEDIYLTRKSQKKRDRDIKRAINHQTSQHDAGISDNIASRTRSHVMSSYCELPRSDTVFDSQFEVASPLASPEPELPTHSSAPESPLLSCESPMHAVLGDAVTHDQEPRNNVSINIYGHEAEPHTESHMNEMIELSSPSALLYEATNDSQSQDPHDDHTSQLEQPVNMSVDHELALEPGAIRSDDSSISPSEGSSSNAESFLSHDQEIYIEPDPIEQLNERPLSPSSPSIRALGGLTAAMLRDAFIQARSTNDDS